MGSISRKLRRKAQQRSQCIYWLNEECEPDLTGIDHSMECRFLGGKGGPDVCFSCHLVDMTHEIWSIGEPQRIRNVPEGFCVLAMPDPRSHFEADEMPAPHWHLRREDGREMYFWRLGEDPEQEHHANGVQICY
jgi:hypothetical protein